MLRQLSTLPKTFPSQILPIFQPHLTHIPSYNYHPSYLMDSKHDDYFVKIDRRAFHLYRDSITKVQKDNFNEKIFILVLIDCVRTKQKFEDFQQLVEYGVRKVDMFEEILSIISFGTQLYLYNHPNKELCEKVARKGFELLAKTPSVKFSSFYLMKFLIFIEKCVGLQKFPDSSYSLINFYKFKPLFLCFSLEMFYENNLQHYPIVETIFNIFTSSASIIPFADIHHYKLATKKIKNPKFKEFIEMTEKHMMQTGTASFSKENPIDSIRNGQQEGLKDTQKQQINDKKTDSTNTNSIPKNQVKSSAYPWEKIFEKQLERRYTYFPSTQVRKTHKKSNISDKIQDV